MATHLRVVVLAAAAAAGALFNAQSAQAAIATAQPHAIVADLVASTSKVVEVGRRGGWGGGGVWRGGWGGGGWRGVARRLARGRMGLSARVVWRRLGLSPWLGWLGIPAGLGLPSLSPLLWRMGMAGLRLWLWLSLRPLWLGQSLGMSHYGYGYGYGGPVVTFSFGGW